mgnify:CR=1 FL=1
MKTTYTTFCADSCGGWDFWVHCLPVGAHGPEVTFGAFYNGGASSWYNGHELTRAPTPRDRAEVSK